MFNFSEIINNLPIYLMRIPVILLALTVHETAHGYIAYKCGDPTAHNLGRLTLNPLKHLDPIGTLMMLLFGFGWAKPVPVNARYFRKPKRDMALTALAGPVSNLFMAFVGIFLYCVFDKIVGLMTIDNKAAYYAVYVVYLFLMVFYSINLSLAVFNLLPVPPLDGSRILFVVLPDKYYFKVMQYERYISLAIMLLLFTGILTRPLSFIMNLFQQGMFWIVRLLPFL